MPFRYNWEQRASACSCTPPGPAEFQEEGDGSQNSVEQVGLVDAAGRRDNINNIIASMNPGDRLWCLLQVHPLLFSEFSAARILPNDEADDAPGAMTKTTTHAMT